MAVTSNKGRYRSVRTKAEELTILREEIDNLDDDEKEVLREMLAEMRAKPRVVKKVKLDDGSEVIDDGRSFFDMIQEAEYEREVVSVERWVSDSYYMGNCQFAWPRWREDLQELFEGGGYHEAVLTGAIGIGKSTMVEMCLLRLIYEYSCLRNPQRTYGLMPGDKIYIVVLNITTDLAKKVVFEGLVNKLEQSPYFNKEFEYEPTQNVIRFPKGLRIIPRASTDTSTLGLNVIGGALSEVNFEGGGHFDNKKSANAQHASQAKNGTQTDISKVYDELVTRLKSRFGRVGKLPGLFILDSSKRDQSDYTEQHLSEVKDDPFVFVRDYAMWDVQPPDRFSKKRFPIFVGDEKVKSRIITEAEVASYKPQEGTNQQVIWVPENWRHQFEKNLDTALRNVAGIATASVDRLISSMSVVDRAMEIGKRDFPSPFPSDVWVGERIPLNWDSLAEMRDGAWVMKRDPRAEHAVHFDIAFRRDRFGLAAGYIAGEKEVERVIGGELVKEKFPIIVIRWCVGIEAPRDSEVPIGIGRAILWSFMNHGGRTRWGSCDQYQSVETLQKMHARGIDEELLSVEGEEAYIRLRDALDEERLILPYNEVLYDELKYLQHDKIRGKVDHLPKKSKDIADAVTGIVTRLTTLFLEGEAKPAAPAPVLGVTELYEDEEIQEETWVLDGTARPVEHNEVGGNRFMHGAKPSPTDTHSMRKKKTFLLK